MFRFIAALPHINDIGKKEKKKIMINNVNEILREVASTSEELAGILDDILKGIDGINDESSLPAVINESIDNFADNMGGINMIPGVPGSFNPLFISKAFGKWGAKTGLKNIASQTITYWLSCTKINRVTIIFTTGPLPVSIFDSKTTPFAFNSKSDFKSKSSA